MSGLGDYAIKQKNDWRGWAWNRLVERLDVPVEQARVVYLCGPEDHDRVCGLRRGLRNENLIAVDTSPENIDRVRRAGGYGVVGTLSNVLRSMSEPLVFHGVLADFCQGIGSGSFDLLGDLTLSPGQKRLVAAVRWPNIAAGSGTSSTGLT